MGLLTTVRAARLAEHAADSGVEVICCVPLFIYNLPQSTGVEITPELMQRIQDSVPQLKGLKHSALTFSNVPNFAEMGLAAVAVVSSDD